MFVHIDGGYWERGSKEILLAEGAWAMVGRQRRQATPCPCAELLHIDERVADQRSIGRRERC